MNLKTNNQMLDLEQVWQQTCSAYQNKTIQQACLTWQNVQGVNINLILILANVQKRGDYFTPTQLKQLELTLHSFNQQITSLVRQARINWRNYQHAAQYQTVKTQLLQCELTIEKQEQTLIVDMLNHFTKDDTQADNQKIAPADWYFKEKKIQRNQAVEELLRHS